MALFEEVAYGGWPHCLRISEGPLELIVTRDVGPRVIRFGFEGGPNVFHEFPEQRGKMSGPSWLSFGGHRLWHAPEVFPRTYAPDFDPVTHQWHDGKLTLTTEPEAATGLSKSIEVSLSGGRVTLRHALMNHNVWAVEAAPWCLSVMAGGGTALVPQEDYYPHPDVLSPARPLVLWHFTKMNDPRFQWGERFIRLHEDSKVPGKQKFGVLNRQGWAGYYNQRHLFLKTVAFDQGARYADYGCNCEIYTEAGFLEVETLGPLTKLEPGASVVHEEQWQLWRGLDLPTDEAPLHTALSPLVSAFLGGRP